MAICYFDGDAKRRYKCDYHIDNDRFVVNAECDPFDLETDENGRVIESSLCDLKSRDITIINETDREYYLIKDARCNGYSINSGLFEILYNSTYESNFFFKTNDVNDLFSLKKTPKVQSVKVFIKNLSYLYPSKSVVINDDEALNKIQIDLNKDEWNNNKEINQNNISSISISDSWHYNLNKNNIDIKISNYIEITFLEEVNYDDLYSYVYELMIYLQLYCPNFFLIDKVLVRIDELICEVVVPVRRPDYSKGRFDPSVKIDLLKFLELCYIKIPYRNSKNEIRNIPYVVMQKNSNIEDNFLTYYRFIECYYKRIGIKHFLEEALKDNYFKEQTLTLDMKLKAREIICLRNHYVHSGYFIKDSMLIINVSFKQKIFAKNPLTTEFFNDLVYNISARKATILQKNPCT